MPEIVLDEPKTKAEFRRYYALRWCLLRKPWGQSRGSERDAFEHEAIHLMACTDRRGVGVGRLHNLSNTHMQIRYMAVLPTWQRRGIGSQILGALEAKAKLLGAREICLDARASTVGFYQQHGYTMLGPGHVLFGEIAHYRMAKKLSP